ncbi:MAG: carbon-nitrogen hydrolase family protein [Planctomycetota bacterium]|nr:carbon-nitrogen hydrolase family protein [Planctomycetota bacterium]
MPRKAKIVTTTMQGRGGPTVEANRARMLERLDIACGEKPDLVCLPETFLQQHVGVKTEDVAEPLDGPTLTEAGMRASAHGTYVICPLLTKRDGRIFNSAVILDRKGKVAGIYDKVQPVTSRADFTCMESGVTPGREAPVFELDFGRVGIQICFDLGFPETWASLAERGAELVFWPSAYDGGFPLRLFAYLHQYYVVSAVKSRHAQIINPLGEVLERTDPNLPYAARTIDLDFRVCHLDFHTSMPEQLKKRYGDGVSVRVYTEEGHFIVESNRDDLPMARIAEENGLEPSRTYYDRHRSAYPALREGKAAEPQAPPYTGRAQYS